MGTEQGVSNRKRTMERVRIDYEDLNTLIEQSVSLNYSNRTFIAPLGNSP